MRQSFIPGKNMYISWTAVNKTLYLHTLDFPLKLVDRRCLVVPPLGEEEKYSTFNKVLGEKRAELRQNRAARFHLHTREEKQWTHLDNEAKMSHGAPTAGSRPLALVCMMANSSKDIRGSILCSLFRQWCNIFSGPAPRILTLWKVACLPADISANTLG